MQYFTWPAEISGWRERKNFLLPGPTIGRVPVAWQGCIKLYTPRLMASRGKYFCKKNFMAMDAKSKALYTTIVVYSAAIRRV